MKDSTEREAPTGDELLRILATLANPHRLRVIAALAAERNYVSRLARELGISRALLQLHLKKLESAGLVSAQLELSEDGKAMKYYEVRPFAVRLTPQAIAVAAGTLTPEPVDPDGTKGPQLWTSTSGRRSSGPSAYSCCSSSW